MSTPANDGQRGTSRELGPEALPAPDPRIENGFGGARQPATEPVPAPEPAQDRDGDTGQFQ